MIARTIGGAAAFAASLIYTQPAHAEKLKFNVGITDADRRIVMTALGFDKLLAAEKNTTGKASEPQIAKVDLNNDGKPDYIVMVRGSYWCGSRGCSASVYLFENGAYRDVLDLTAHDVELGNGSTNGMRDIVLNGAIRWVWDGKAYVVRK